MLSHVGTVGTNARNGGGGGPWREHGRAGVCREGRKAKHGRVRDTNTGGHVKEGRKEGREGGRVRGTVRFVGGNKLLHR